MSSLTSSLCSNRRDTQAAAQGALSVSFSEKKGLSGLDINDILGGLEDDGEMEGEGSLSDIFGGKDVNNGDKSKGHGSISLLESISALETIQDLGKELGMTDRQIETLRSTKNSLASGRDLLSCD